MDGLAPFWAGVLGAVVAGFFGTSIGGVPVIVVRTMPPRLGNMLLSFAAGIMLAATFFSLLLPALELAGEATGGRVPAAITAIAALSIGGLAMAGAHRLTPHEHLGRGREGPLVARIRRVWLFVIAIAIHNFPEGLATGVAAGNPAPHPPGEIPGLGVVVGIGLQNVPEGLAVAVGLLSLGYGRRRAFLAAAATGLIEVVGGVAGAGAVSLSHALLPWALAFAAGAMLFVISHEIIPETHASESGDSVRATLALFVGFATMLFLDHTLG
ncbi:MAG: ZIP family metal transporter [Alphaproteobacteria bacterium]|nr:ZIP family metal transporter [Alphaproteobacteria bacterium]